MDDDNIWRLRLEQRIWDISALAGFIGLGIFGIMFLLYGLIYLLKVSVNLGGVGLSHDGVLIIVSLLFSYVVIRRFWYHAISLIISLSTWLGRLLQAAGTQDDSHIEEMRTSTHYQAIFIFLIMSVMMFFLFIEAQNDTINVKEAWLIDGVSLQVLETILFSLMYSGMGVASLSFFAIVALEIISSWRNSWLQRKIRRLQRKIRSSDLYWWWNPRRVVLSDIKKEDQKEDD